MGNEETAVSYSVENNRKKRIITITAVVAIIAVAAGLVFRFTVYPNMKAQSLLTAASNLEDSDFKYSFMQTSGQESFGWSVDGTLLKSTEQANLNFVNTDNGEETESVAATLDGSDLYINTRSLFRVIGPLLVGDSNDAAYCEEIYDDIFSVDTTMVNLESYACPIWTWDTPWMHCLNMNVQSLISEAREAFGVKLHYSASRNTYTAEMSSEDTVAALTQFRNYVDDNAAYVDEDIIYMLRNYSIELSRLGGVYGEDIMEWADARANEMEATQTFVADCVAKLDEVIALCKEHDGYFTHTIQENNKSVVEICTLTVGEESYVFQREICPSVYTNIEDIPEEYETLGTQLALLESITQEDKATVEPEQS